MDPEEVSAELGIRRTLARYTMAVDAAKVDEFVELFTEDALFGFDDGGPGGFRCEGRRAIRSWREGFVEQRRQLGDAAPAFVRHHLTTSLVELDDGDTASGRTYFHVYTQIGPDHAGYYSDRFRRQGSLWLFQERIISVDWRAPGGVAGSQTSVEPDRG